MQLDCPNCGEHAAFVVQQGAGKDPDTGYFDGEFLVCLECGTATDAEEIERQEGKWQTN